MADILPLKQFKGWRIKHGNSTENPMRLPKYIDVFGNRIKVIVKDYPTAGPDDYIYGEACSARREIYINSAEGLDSQRRTLFHERLHMILGLAGVSQLLDPDLEEAIVVAFENGLWPEISKLPKK